MSRPKLEGIEFGDRLDLEFIGRKNTELVAGPEEGDRHDQGTGELETVVLGEGRRHRGAGQFPLDGSFKEPGPGRDHRGGVSRSGGTLA